MDRRVHNFVKLSAALFLLNACGFAMNEKKSSPETTTVKITKNSPIESKSSNCYELVSATPTITKTYEEDDLFTYNRPLTADFKPDGTVRNSDQNVRLTQSDCI